MAHIARVGNIMRSDSYIMHMHTLLHIVVRTLFVIKQACIFDIGIHDVVCDSSVTFGMHLVFITV
jgi:hypothetical protein